MRPHSEADHDDIDLAVLWRALRRGLPGLLALALVAGALTYGVLSLIAPKYTSEAQLAVVAKGTTNPFADPKSDGASAESLLARVDKEAVNTHVGAVLSPDLAVKISADLDLAAKVEFNSALGNADVMSRLLRLVGLYGPKPGENDQNRVLGVYFRNLEVYSPKESRTIFVRYSSLDPQLAADVANRIADTYRETLATQSLDETDEVQKALRPKIDKLTEEVAEADAQVERFRGEANIFRGGPQGTGLNEQQLGELTAEVTKAQAARSEAEARAKSAHELIEQGSADALPEVQKSPLIQNLVQQRVRVERQIAELSATLLPGHPRMRQLRADLAGLNRQLGGEVSKVVEGLEKEATFAALREDAVKKSLDEIKARVVNTSGDEARLRQLETLARSKRAELERLQARFEANRAHADSRAVPVEAQIVARARPASAPSYPKKGAYASLLAAAALLFGMAWVATRAVLIAHTLPAAAPSPTPVTQPAHAQIAGLPAASSPISVAPRPVETVPVIEVAALDAGAVPLRLTSVSKLARYLHDCAPGHGGFRTLLVAESEGIDIGLDASQLAVALAEAGHTVVLVDWSLNGNGIAAPLGYPATPGVSELLTGKATFERVIKRQRGSHVHFIASGAASVGAADELKPDVLNLALDALDEAYEHIVVAGHWRDARLLFETIEGRFDAGVLACDVEQGGSVVKGVPGSFLGFEVADIHLVRLEREAEAMSRPQRERRQPSKGAQEARVT